jgi:hypothetical protein
MDKKAKLLQALKLSQAMKSKSEAFVLLAKLDTMEEKIDAIKMPDNADIKQELKNIKQELEQDLIIELDIV